MRHFNKWPAFFRFCAALLSLLLSAGAGLGVTPATLPTDEEIVDVLWQWERFEGGDDSVMTVDDPSLYTLILKPDGTYRVKADCNTSMGAYVLKGNSLTLEPGPMTLVECEPGSLYDNFLKKLGYVRTYVVHNGKLVLNLFADAGNMIFAPAGKRGQSDMTMDGYTLENLEFRTGWTASKSAFLADGEYSEPAAPGSATKTIIKLHDRMAFGHTADGRPLTAAVLITDPGGSGTFYDLVAVVNRGGKPVHVATVNLGDRVKIESLVIENGQIVVQMITQGPDEPMACPTLRVVRRYVLQGENLVSIDSIS